MTAIETARTSVPELMNPPGGASRVFPAILASGRDFRAMVVTELTGNGDTEAVELVAAEFAANVTRHTDSVNFLGGAALLPGKDSAILYTVDSSLQLPFIKHAANDAESGRGLNIVDQITGGRWGSTTKVPEWIAPLYPNPEKLVYAITPLQVA